MTQPRRILSIQPGQPATDGAGVRLNRVIGGPALVVPDEPTKIVR